MLPPRARVPQPVTAVAPQSAATVRDAVRQAVEGLERADMLLYAAAARWQRGRILGGDEGQALVVTAEATRGSNKRRGGVLSCEFGLRRRGGLQLTVT